MRERPPRVARKGGAEAQQPARFQVSFRSYYPLVYLIFLDMNFIMPLFFHLLLRPPGGRRRRLLAMAGSASSRLLDPSSSSRRPTPMRDRRNDVIFTLIDIDGANGTPDRGALGTITVTHEELLMAHGHTITKTRPIGDGGALLEFRISLNGESSAALSLSLSPFPLLGARAPISLAVRCRPRSFRTVDGERPPDIARSYARYAIGGGEVEPRQQWSEGVRRSFRAGPVHLPTRDKADRHGIIAVLAGGGWRLEDTRHGPARVGIRHKEAQAQEGRRPGGSSPINRRPEEDGRVVRRVVRGGPIPQRCVRRDCVVRPPRRVRRVVDDTGDARSRPPKDDGLGDFVVVVVLLGLRRPDEAQAIAAEIASGVGSASLLVVSPRHFLVLYMLGSALAPFLPSFGGSGRGGCLLGRTIEGWARWWLLGDSGASGGSSSSDRWAFAGASIVAAGGEGRNGGSGGRIVPWRLSKQLVALIIVMQMNSFGFGEVIDTIF